MKTNTLTLDISDYPDLANLYHGQEVELKLKCTLIMKRMEGTTEYAELAVSGASVTEKEKLSVFEVMALSLMQQQKGTNQNFAV